MHARDLQPNYQSISGKFNYNNYKNDTQLHLSHIPGCATVHTQYNVRYFAESNQLLINLPFLVNYCREEVLKLNLTFLHHIIAQLWKSSEKQNKKQG